MSMSETPNLSVSDNLKCGVLDSVDRNLRLLQECVNVIQTTS